MKRVASKQFRETFFYKNHMRFVLTIIVLFVNSVLVLGIAKILQEAIDIAVGGTSKELLHIVLFTLLYIVGIAMSWLMERKVRNSFLERGIKQYKQQVFEKITKKNISSFGTESMSRYISALTNDIASIETNYLGGAFNLMVDILYFLGAVAMMLWYNWQLTLIAVALATCSLLISLIIGKTLLVAEQRVSDANRDFVGMVKDLLEGFQVIKSFQAEKEVLRLFNENNSELEYKKCNRRKTESLINIIGMTMGLLTQTGLVMAGVYLTLQGRITAGVLVAFIQLMNFLINPTQQIPTLLANRRAASTLINKMANDLSKNIPWAGTKSVVSVEDGIRFEDVSFGYDAENIILNHINVVFEAGKSYAIVGGSGSGKSTLLHLLLGSYAGYEGKILFDNEELRNMTIDSLYDLVSIIVQNVFVFDSTIEKNITMFKEFPDCKVQSAVMKAGLQTLLEERGADYNCGENGKGLSGGERQRISIARSLLKETPILLMDEATAALDSATAYAVEDAILSIKGLTRIIVTHKLEEKILSRYDEIIVLSNGSIVEKGSFKNLLNKDGYFSALYRVSHRV